MKRIGARQTSSHVYTDVQGPSVPRSQFNLSHGYKSAFDGGYLVPFFADVAYPGDTFNLKTNCFARLSTPIVPFMDNLYLDTFFFAVPWRLVWTNFKKFMGEQANPGDSTSYTIPQCVSKASGYDIGSLQDYFGLPTAGQVTAGETFTHNNHFLRAYNLIWDEWFRDENMQNSVTVDVGDGPDTYTNYSLLKRGNVKNYFTSALTSPQKATAVTLPLGSTAPVKGIGKGNQTFLTNIGPVYESGGTTPTFSFGQKINDANANEQWYMKGTAAAGGYPDIYADLTNATAATINQFRQAIQLQGWYERDARSGTRYTEIIQGHFGVVSSDARLQRPEYLGGTSTPVKINPVAQTNATGASGTPQGNLAAVGVVGTPSHGFVKSFEEHCLVIGLVNVRAELSYQQGVNRMWTDQTRADLYWPAFAHLGEQTILMQEIYAKGGSGASNDTVVFGYAERYSHLKYKQSMITGKMRSTAATTLDVWHLAQKYTSNPTLGNTFIQQTPPIDRVVATTTEPQFIFDAWFDFKAIRPMPVYGTPATLSRF